MIKGTVPSCTIKQTGPISVSLSLWAQTLFSSKSRNPTKWFKKTPSTGLFDLDPMPVGYGDAAPVTCHYALASRPPNPTSTSYVGSRNSHSKVKAKFNVEKEKKNNTFLEALTL